MTVFEKEALERLSLIQRSQRLQAEMLCEILGRLGHLQTEHLVPQAADMKELEALVQRAAQTQAGVQVDRMQEYDERMESGS